MMCLGVGLFEYILFGTLCFLDLYVYFLHQIRGVFFHYFSNRFPISCSFSFLSGTPMMQMLHLLKLSQQLLMISLFCFVFLRFYLFILERGEGKEKEERNINVWLPLVRPLLGTWPVTQACALIGNWTGDHLVCSPRSVHWTTPARALGVFYGFFFLLLVLCGCFLLLYDASHWFDSWLHPLYCCFPINCSLFQLVYPSFLSGSFLCCWDPH